MLRRFHQRKGFTLIELAIVVGVAGLLFSGLWRLMSSGSSQLREQAAADQINQVVSATRNFLASQQGQGLLTLMGPGTAQELTLPDAGGCPGALPANQNTYCNFTPAGFTGATANSFNQTYRVFARKLSGAVNAAAANYDFVVFTTGGDIIPDASGGRISANIGASGGFIYADASVCATPLATLADNAACGAFGGFALNLLAAPPTGLSLVASPLSGHIVTLNGSGTSNTNNSPWLARTNLPNDTGFFFNTMQENLFMGANQRLTGLLTPGTSTIAFAPSGPGVTPGIITMNRGIINLNTGPGGAVPQNPANGTINLDGGAIQGNFANAASILGGTITINNTEGTGALVINSRVSTNPTGAAGPTAQITGQDCDNTSGGACTAALNIDGSVNIIKSLVVQGNGNANEFKAFTFIYNSDMRAKKNIEPLTGALDKVSRLQGYKFNWRKDGREDIGVIAQEVEKVYPELVHDTGGGKLGVEYGNLVAPMIEAIKELRQENRDLKLKLETQQRAIERLQKAKP